jgi:hypothetical protein
MICSHNIYLQLLTMDGYHNICSVKKSVNIKEGNKLGPIVCSVYCHPNCNFVWQNRRTADSFSAISSSQSLEIYNIAREQSGKYRCRFNQQKNCPLSSCFARQSCSLDDSKLNRQWDQACFLLLY